MEEPSSSLDNFPQFSPSNLHFSDRNLFAGGELPIASDFDFDDLDNFDVDFLEGLIVVPSNDGNEVEIERIEYSPISQSDVTTNSNSNSNSCPVSPESGVVHKELKQEDDSNSRLKRKIDDDGENGVGNPNSNPNHNPKLRRSDEVDSLSTCGGGGGGGNDEDEKRKVRLMRNRESAQLSRQRKKHYVEELEEKVKVMNSTIADLNAKISFYMVENTRLRQQLNGNKGNDCKGNSNPVPSVVYPPPLPPHLPPYHFPWIPYALIPNGHPLPYIPIPRLKPEQPAAALKTKRSESKKSESRTKKVASASLLGLFLIMLVFGGVVNFGIGGSGNKVYGNGRVLNVRSYGSSFNSSAEFGLFSEKMGSENSGGNCKNTSESLPALLYVPRNGKHVEINGNLIIHLVLASERSMAQAESSGQGKQLSGNEGTGLAIPGLLVSGLAVPKGSMEMGRHSTAYRSTAEHQRALPSESHDTYSEHIKSTRADIPLQQWFREGLAGLPWLPIC